MRRALCTLLILLLTAAVPALAENAIPQTSDEAILLTEEDASQLLVSPISSFSW